MAAFDICAELPNGFEAPLSAWGPSARIEGRLGGGHRGAVWSVRVGDRRYVARLSSRAPDALAWEVELLDFLRGAGMLVPEVLPASGGRRHADGMVLYGWLEGEPPDSARDWMLVARELGRLHELARNWPQRPGFLSTRQLLAEAAGGDVRLDRMPAEAVGHLRAAWVAIADEPASVVHGDPGAGNIRIRSGRVGFLDWDEARVDASVLDLAGLPLDLAPEVGTERLERARRAVDAWEAAGGWSLEPEYARRRLARLRGTWGAPER